MSLTSRFAASRIADYQSVNPVVFLNGARQTGKTTLVRRLLDQEFDYVSLDSAIQLSAATANPESFVRRTSPLIIDEVQLAPEIFRGLKVAVDELRLQQPNEANGRYLLTGSANILAFPKLSDALVGRMSILTLYPFAVSEVLGAAGQGLGRIMKQEFDGLKNSDLTIEQAINLATFPEISGASARTQSLWFEGYLSTILQRDVRALADLEKITVLPLLLRVLATRAGGLINDSDIARELQLNSVTGKFYRNVLKMLFLNFDVPPWHRNIGKRLVKAGKGYMIDTAMTCYLLGIQVPGLIDSDPVMAGRILENFVATELVKLISFTAENVGLYHFRTADGKEVDFILEQQDGGIHALEVKLGETVSAHDFRHVKALMDLYPEKFRSGIVLYGGREVVPFGDKLWAVPYAILWQ